MNTLEKLYDCACRYLEKDRDWLSFSVEFGLIFDCEFALYRTSDEDAVAVTAQDSVLATSNLDCMQDFFENRLYQMRPMQEGDLIPLEPHRRTDYFSDEQVRELGPFYTFMQKHGVFYLMIAPALMPDGSVLSLTVWRSEDEPNFDDVEKQRLALFMRYLLALVRDSELKMVNHESRLSDFGERYGLTSAEIEVLGALLAGHSLREIATKSGRSYGTVRWHVRNILSKCHVNSQKNLLHEFYALIEN